MGPDVVEWSNVQGLVLSGYGRLRCAAFVLFKLEDPEPNRLSREWLWRLTQRLTNADQDVRQVNGASNGVSPVYAHNLAALHAMTGATADEKRPDVWALNLALMPSGLLALGATPAEVGHFADEFQKGMAPPQDTAAQPRRTSLLGDVGASSPDLWRWGGWAQPASFDGMLLLYAVDAASLNRLVETELCAMRGVAKPLHCRMACEGELLLPQTGTFEGNAGHFGFVDGISQPVIAGSRQEAKLTARDKRLHVVPPGEVVLGYRDTRGGVVTTSDPRHPGTRDLARNGTYLVARQLEQDTDAFEAFLDAAADAALGQSTLETRALIAAKLLGRTLAGEALVPAPAGRRDGTTRRNDFLYRVEDAAGLACPIGAHIRRANPRDLIGPDPDLALYLSKMHRIMRRGRPYGLDQPADGEPIARGILFLCLNASIANQFELVQHTWINNPAFGDLDGEIDPLSHIAGGTLTIQARPSNIRLQQPKPFVTVRGGAYFFMPGINALRQLCA